MDVDAPGAGELCLTRVGGYHAHTVALHVATRGDAVLVGDMMKSLTLLRFAPGTGAFEVAAQDPGMLWVTAAAFADDATLLAADHDHNLFVAARDAGAATEERRGRLDLAGFHTGEFVNAIVPGSLVMLPEEAEADEPPAGADAAAMDEDGEPADAAAAAAAGARGAKRRRGAGGAADAGAPAPGRGARGAPAGPTPRFILAGVGGSLSALISLPAPLARYLRRAAAALARVVRAPGGVAHAAFRAPYGGELADAAATGGPPGGSVGEGDAAHDAVLDGDLLEALLDLPPVDQERVVAFMNRGGGEGGGGGPPPPDAALHPSGAGAGAGPATLAELVKTIEDLSRLH